MSTISINDPRFIFACLCWFGMLVILLGALWEIRGRFAEAVLSERHFWTRMISAMCWLAALGLLSFAVIAQWPVPGDQASKHIFARYLLAGMIFLLGALLTSVIDFLLFWRMRDIYRRHLSERLGQMVENEIEKHREAGENATKNISK